MLGCEVLQDGAGSVLKGRTSAFSLDAWGSSALPLTPVLSQLFPAPTPRTQKAAAGR